MQSIALNFTAPVHAARETWKNGVVHSDDGPSDVYELPTGVPGVARRIEVRPIMWGLLGQEVTVTDCLGKRLEGARSDGQVTARDPLSGLETVLDPKRHTISVATPTVREKLETGPHAFRTTYGREVLQEVDAEGNCRLQTNLQGESEGMMYSMVREMPPNQTMLTRDDKSWEETRIARGGEPVSHRWQAEKHSRQEGSQLESSVSADGKLTVVGEDQISRSYEMFLRV